jgi:AraC family transcriptional regulator, regulatory protein of adaptative response / methylated-DNA-[protein]-cysteine methyltransferase
MPSDYDLIEKAIRYLETNFREQPTLEELAAHLHLSPYHLQRTFRRWAGISPKRFLQFLTVAYAKQLLAESRSVLETTYEAGLSSPSRLHDLFVTLEAVTPGEFKAQGAGMRLAYGFHDSPFGECLLAASERGIAALSFVTEGDRAGALTAVQSQWPGAEWQEDEAVTRPLVEQIFPVREENGLSPGERDNGRNQLTLFVRGSNFQVKVWEALLRIPPGYACTYQDIARQIGKPKASQAVGNAVGANSIAYLIPCHRVIRKSGVLGDYRWQPARKKAMLGWEAAQRINHG